MSRRWRMNHEAEIRQIVQDVLVGNGLVGRLSAAIPRTATRIMVERPVTAPAGERFIIDNGTANAEIVELVLPVTDLTELTVFRGIAPSSPTAHQHGAPIVAQT